jgi:SSS family solute:Na+ symporter
MEIKLIFLFLYFFVMLAIGINSALKIKKPDDFYLAGKKSRTLFITGSLLATIIGSSAILGTINLSYHQGWASAWLMLCASIGCFALLPMAKYVSRYGKYTLPQLVGDFYGKNAEQVCSIIIPIAWIGVIAAQVIGAAMIISGYIGISYETAVLLTGSIFIIYTIIGGQISVIKTDFIQSIMIFVGLFVFALFLHKNSTTNVLSTIPTTFPFNSHFTSWDLIVLIFTYSSTFFVGPDIYSRLFCAKNERVASRSVLITAIVLFFFAILISYVGVSLTHLFPNIDSSKTISLITAIDKYLPAWASGLVIAAFLSAVLSSASTTLLTSSTILSEPLLRRKKGTDKYSTKNTRIFVLLLGIAAMILAMKITSIISSFLIALTLFSGAFIIPIAAGLFGYRVVKKTGVAAMITGGVIALTGKIIAMSYNDTLGNIIIICGFIANAAVLFLPNVLKKRASV